MVSINIQHYLNYVYYLSSWPKSNVCLYLSPFHVIQETASQWHVSVHIVTLRSYGMDSDVACMHST